MSDIVCRYCEKKLGDFAKHGTLAMKKRSKSYDMYYFCKEGDCLEKYMDNGEIPEKELSHKNTEAKR